MSSAAYTLALPARRTSSVVFSSPHSGRAYWPEFVAASVLDLAALRSSEDAYVDDLFAAAPALGAPLLSAVAPRAYVDLNRGAEEMDPALIEGVRPGAYNPRIASGLGVIPRVVSGGRAIWRGKLARGAAEARVEQWWKPYHGALAQVLDETHARFGEAILLDCHSMPHEAIRSHRAVGGLCPDVVLGDRFGASADARIVARVEALLRAEGLRVARNAPFAGGYITQHYGVPARGRHAVQIEIDRALYMDEKAIRPRPDFAAFKALITRVVAGIADIGRPDLALAAE